MSLLAFSFLITNTIPFFSAFQNLVGALFAAPTMFGWPALFYLYGMRKHGVATPVFARIICCFFLFIVTPFCTVVVT